MKTKSGKVKNVIYKANGMERKVFRLIALEPALWDQYDRLAGMAGVDRSTFIRCELKRCRKSKIAGVDWSEIE
jgi:hypothetical protein